MFMLGTLPGAARSLSQRLVQARSASVRSQYQVSVNISPCAVCRPSAPISGAKIKRPAKLCPPLTMPNSAPCLIELMVSPPALARPMTLAFDDCACSRNEEKSVGVERDADLAEHLAAIGFDHRARYRVRAHDRRRNRRSGRTRCRRRS